MDTLPIKHQNDQPSALAQAAGSATSSSEILYSTGCTQDGVMLIGGVWTLRDQCGFPLEMAHLVARDRGGVVDWAEAVADASRSNNFPALLKAVEAFLPEQAIAHIKAGFMQMIKSGKSFEQVIAEKRANGKRMEAFIRSNALPNAKDETGGQ